MWLEMDPRTDRDDVWSEIATPTPLAGFAMTELRQILKLFEEVFLLP